MIYVDVDGTTQGPFSPDELSALWRAGDIDASARYWYRGMLAWATVASFVPPTENPATPGPWVVLTRAALRRFVSKNPGALQREEEALPMARTVTDHSWVRLIDREPIARILPAADPDHCD